MKFEQLHHPSRPPDDNRPAPKTVVEIPSRIHLEGLRKQALDTGRNRLLVTGVLFIFAFAGIAGRLVELALLTDKHSPRNVRVAHTAKSPQVRADIVDRNGILLATSLPTAALYANPRHVLDPARAAQKLARVLPDADAGRLEKKMASKGTFVWLHRNLTPKLQFQVNALGIPGVYFQKTERRVYPHGKLLSHVLGLTNIDGDGLSGVEQYFNGSLKGAKDSLRLTLDIRLQSIMREELAQAVDEFSAIGAAGVIFNVRNGEVGAMVSLPDYDSNHPVTAAGEAGFNRVTKGVYEMGSTFKLFTAAMALDSGAAKLKDRYDASKAIKISRFTITDYHGKNRWLSVPEILIYSSNIGAARMAMDVGTKTQKRYLANFGMLRPVKIELPEIGAPLTPDRWRKINTMTISYGHGIAVSPLQLVAGVGALVNGGILYDPTVMVPPRGARATGKRVLSVDTSLKMRRLMSLIVKKGTGKNARVEGYSIGGKTGTADKPGKRGYSGRRVISSFIAAFPIDNPRYVILALIDEPKGIKRTHGYATGGWVAAPIISRVVKRMAPMLGLAPEKSKKPSRKRSRKMIVAARKNDFGSVVKTVKGLKGGKNMTSGSSKRNTGRSKPIAAN